MTHIVSVNRPRGTTTVSLCPLGRDQPLIIFSLDHLEQEQEARMDRMTVWIQSVESMFSAYMRATLN